MITKRRQPLIQWFRAHGTCTHQDCPSPDVCDVAGNPQDAALFAQQAHGLEQGHSFAGELTVAPFMASWNLALRARRKKVA